MRGTLLRAGALALAALAWGQAAAAQGPPAGAVPPRRVSDGRGVDLVSGSMPINIPLVSFGDQATALFASLDPGSSGQGSGGPVINDFHQFVGAQMGAHLLPQAYYTGADGSPDEFGAFENFVFPTGAGFAQQLGSYPRLNPDQSLSIHTNPDGTRTTHSLGTSHFTRFQSSDPNLSGIYDGAGDRGVESPTLPGLFERMVFANGEEWRFYRQFVTVPCTLYCQTSPRVIHRLRFITSSRGYGIQFLYESDATPASNGVAGLWWAPRRVTAYNKAVIACDESLLQECPAVSALPSAEISYNSAARTVTITEPGQAEGVELSFVVTNDQCCVLSAVRQTAVPGSTVSFQYAADNAGAAYISRVTDSDGDWNYTHSTYVDDSGHLPLMSATSTNPAGGVNTIFGYGSFGTIQWNQDELGRTYNYADGFPFRDWGRSEPEGNATQIDRDERNNITAITRQPRPNSGSPPIIVYRAVFPADCTNPRTCNRPSSTSDGNGNVTDYTYAPEHGGVLTETGPALGGVRSQKRYDYAQRTAWIRNGAASYVAGPPIWLLVRERACRTTAPSGAGCAGGSVDEVVTDYDYGPDSGPNNLLLRGVAVTAHDGTAIVTRRSCYGYDALGRRISETQPNANLASCS